MSKQLTFSRVVKSWIAEWWVEPVEIRYPAARFYISHNHSMTWHERKSHDQRVTSKITLHNAWLWGHECNYFNTPPHLWLSSKSSSGTIAAFSWRKQNFCWASPLVSMSATISRVGQHWRSVTPPFSCSLTKWCFVFLCLLPSQHQSNPYSFQVHFLWNGFHDCYCWVNSKFSQSQDGRWH